ncbi:MAG TPA: hypothetical protein GXZ58_10650 [Bacilli bacterium]|nr:hypothetical protein [Bacilli bacterium]
MESYLIIFLKTHLKYWWIYLVSILFAIPAYYFSLLVGFLFIHATNSTITAHILTAASFTIVYSIPFIVPNYQAGKKIHNLFQRRPILHYTLLCQFSFALFIFISALIFFKIIVGDL